MLIEIEQAKGVDWSNGALYLGYHGIVMEEMFRKKWPQIGHWKPALMPARADLNPLQKIMYDYFSWRPPQVSPVATPELIILLAKAMLKKHTGSELTQDEAMAIKYHALELNDKDRACMR